MPRLQISDLAWSPIGEQALLDGIELAVGDGQLVGLLGPNGSGKTSLLRCAYRFQRPDQGRVELDGEALWSRSPRWCAQRVAVVLQEFPQDFGLTVAEVAAMGRTPHKGLFDGDDQADVALVELALARVGLTEHKRQAFAHLSGGEKQRVLLARSLVQQPTLLILDEPTNHLDPRYQLELLRLIKTLGLATLASFHDLNLAAAFCDRLYVLDHGRVVASGTPTEVLTEALLAEVYGVQVLVDRHPLAGHPRITWINP
ncbi:MAG: ABC transporter ATP-binding protein [Gammaproteobacteria bacterium]|uniref:ABC transporter ATP-binding protein n=1 Tax=Pseudomonas sp. TaxID=306 RepID=UPI001D7D9FCF|nr:ABC transporter ATP-binding protein [Gammaproteobacteria bacterium]MBU2155626.1 ABC transporter ATP-binding protein [Gammaproteobacteria bacterium]MBU2254946.1 ABC transporter ATP-binding protein [Gammaproteobacteria bacterium]MBU2295532.1 ABC transporter ATP-binding protein [Gammaproteobacteria bacterium]